MTAAVAVCAALDALLPQPPAGSRWVPPRRAVSWVALNLRHARNAVPAGAVPSPKAIRPEGRNAEGRFEGAVATAAAAVQAGAAVLEQVGRNGVSPEAAEH